MSQSVASVARPGGESAGELTRGYFGLLLVQALALFTWWPKNDLVDVLVARSPPVTLVALLVVTVLCLGYRQLRCGESLVPAPLADAGTTRAWTHLLAQLRVLGHSLMLSSPLILIAWSVSPAPAAALALALAGVGVAALVVGLLSAVLTAWLQGEALRFFLARLAALVALLLPGALWAPFNGFAWLRARLDANAAAPSLPVHDGAGGQALLLYAGLCLVLGVVVALQHRGPVAGRKAS